MGTLNEKLLTKPSISMPKEKAGDPRVGHLLGKAIPDSTAPTAALIGFPCDEGVKRNGGRTGAAGAPQLIREAFYKLTAGGDSRHSITEVVQRMADWGDIVISGSLEKDQELLGEAVGAALTQGTIPIVLGGGHETAFGHFLGYVELKREVEILNFDAHPDVRPLVDHRGHSGSPFRQAIEHSSGLCRRYAVAGLQPHACAQAHLEYISSKKGEFVFRRALSTARVDSLFSRLKPSSMVSFDLDAVDETAAPGVSAPCTGGLSVELWLTLAANAGAHSCVSSMDIVEMNPSYDIDGRTARLAALTIWHFLSGLSERIRNEKRPRLGFGS